MMSYNALWHYMSLSDSQISLYIENYVVFLVVTVRQPGVLNSLCRMDLALGLH